jgi:uncharacterized SAM-binding protein YcdF (DUF218 family)
MNAAQQITSNQNPRQPDLTFCGFRASDKNLVKRLADLGVDPSRISMESQSRTTSEDALYSAALPKTQ